MKNNRNYFSHDCNAREDEKIVQLRAKYGRTWYWVWRLVVEKLSEATDYKLLLACKEFISTLYLVDKEVIEDLFTIWLLECDDKYFWSPSLLHRMEIKDWAKQKQSEWGKKAMEKRRWEVGWNKSLITNKVNKNKIKEKKENKKEIVPIGTPAVYGNEEINLIISKIKEFNNGICDWTQENQRMFWKHLLNKLKDIQSVKDWKFTYLDILTTILTIISKNEYHGAKIAWPEILYRNLTALMQVCRQEIQKTNKNKTETF